MGEATDYWVDLYLDWLKTKLYFLNSTYILISFFFFFLCWVFCLWIPASGLEQSEIDAIQASELTSSYEILHKYRDICVDEGVSAIPT